MNTICNVLALLIVFSAVYLSVKTNILKDKVLFDPADGPIEIFSFARTQGLWWTTIIAACFVVAFGVSGKVVELNSTCLVLLGIGVGTTAVAKVIDTNRKNNQEADDEEAEAAAEEAPAPIVEVAPVAKKTKKKKYKSSFFYDILSDSSGITVYRYQALIFNVIFSVVFLVEFVQNMNGSTPSFPVFESETLGLLGISATTYLGMKATEK